MQNFFYSFNFYLFGLIAIASALAFVTRKSPVAAALWLVQVMMSLAVLYIMMDAHFIGAVQVLVYAGDLGAVWSACDTVDGVFTCTTMGEIDVVP